MSIPIILGLPLHGWIGILMLILLAGQLLSGLRVIKVSFKLHKANGITIFCLAALHATIGLGIWFGWFIIK